MTHHPTGGTWASTQGPGEALDTFPTRASPCGLRFTEDGNYEERSPGAPPSAGIAEASLCRAHLCRRTEGVGNVRAPPGAQAELCLNSVRVSSQ